MTLNFNDLKIHPVAAAFPPLEGDDFDNLVESVRANGLLEDLTITADETILVDGINRGQACLKAGIPLRFTKLASNISEDEIRAFILAKNLDRRHLDAGQIAGVALALEKVYAAEGKEQQRQAGGSKPGHRGGGRKVSLQPDPAEAKKNNPQAAERAAKDTGASATSVKDMKRLEKNAPDLHKKVFTGKMTLNAALKELKERERRHKESLALNPKEEKPTPVKLILKTHEGVDVEYPKPKSKATFQRVNEQIAWAGWSWNPVTGCLHGCKYCYAREIAMNNEYYPVGFTPLFHHQRLEAPANTKVPTEAGQDPVLGRVFVCSMADLYGAWVPEDWIKQVHQACIDCPQWEYLFLTKFPSRYTKLGDLPKTAWLGTTVDSQRRVAVAESVFRDISDVRAKWLSLEPLLEPLRFKDLSVFDFVVVGAQSRTIQPDIGRVDEIAPKFEWVADIWHQAKEAGCRVFLKPNLMPPPDPKGTKPGMLLPEEVPILHDTRRGRKP